MVKRTEEEGIGGVGAAPYAPTGVLNTCPNCKRRVSVRTLYFSDNTIIGCRACTASLPRPTFKVWVEIERVPTGEGSDQEYMSAAEPVPAGEFDTIEKASEAVKQLTGEYPGYLAPDGIA